VAVAVLLDVQNLIKHYPAGRGMLGLGSGVVKAVDGVDFQIERGTTLGLVGESGCGKTTVGKSMLLLQRPTGGRIVFDGQDLTAMDGGEIRAVRKRLGIVYQNPHASLNPRSPVIDLVSRPLAVHGIGARSDRGDQVAAALQRVGLSEEHLGRYPHEFSGGQKQRIAIARALITEPDFVVLDEPTSALDVSVQAQILRLLRQLQADLDLTCLFISHDISVVRYMSDKVAVMYVGRLVERASRRELFGRPLHPYTQALLSVVPIPDPTRRNRERKILRGDVASPIHPPKGCRFHPRCDRAHARCRTETPSLLEAGPDHFVACHLYTPRNVGLAEEGNGSSPDGRNSFEG
jgi:oligopeptide transport system ATP-binding protein